MSEVDLTVDKPQVAHIWVHLYMLPSGDVRVTARLDRYGLRVEVTGKTQGEAVSAALNQLAADLYAEGW